MRVTMGLDAVVVLCSFARSATFDEAYAAASVIFELGRGEFDATVAELLSTGALTSEARENEPRASETRSHELVAKLRDPTWLLAYRSAIERAAAGKLVVDLTDGGVLAVIAAKAGARKVYAFTNAESVAMCRELLAANRVEDRVELVIADTGNLELPERGEVLLHDLVGANPFAWRTRSILESARSQLLVPDARLIPFRLDLSFVGVDVTHADDLAEDHAATEVGRLVGVELDPLSKRVARERARRPMTGPPSLLPRHVITNEVPFLSFDLRCPWREQVPAHAIALDFDLTAYGRLAGVAGLVRVHFDEQTQVGNHPSLPSMSMRHAWYGLPAHRAMYLQPKDRMALMARVDGGVEIVVELA